MKNLGKLLVAGSAVAMLAGCMHRGVENVSAGDVTIDSLSATRTAILRVENNSGNVVRVYMKMPGMKDNYIAKSQPGNVRSWLLDPQMFPAQTVSFDVIPDGGSKISVGPYRINKNETVELVVPADVNRTRATVHQSTR